MDKPMEIKRTPTPILYTYKGQLEASLFSNDFNTAVNIKTSENINEVKKLTFTIPFTKDRKLNYGSNEKLVYFDNVLYIIKEMEFEDNDSNKDINVTCEEYCSVLKNVKCDAINEIGKSPQDIFNAIVSASQLDIGYQWLGTDVPNNIYRHLITTVGTSCYENLIQMANVFNGSIEFSYNESGQGFIFLRSKPKYTGKYFKDGVDLKSLNVTYNSDELYTKIFATGYTDDAGIVLDVQAVNNGQSLLIDKSYFIALGVPSDLLNNDAQYNTIYEFNDTTYTDASDLLEKAKEELAKCCRPKITAEITISDLSQIVGYPVERPEISMDIQVINKEIDYIFDSFITGIERDYSNPLETKLTISNDIPYRTFAQDANKTADIVSSITTPDPTPSDGSGDSGDGTTKVIASKCVDGDGINVVRRIGDNTSLITQTGNLISLKVDDIKGDYSELKVTVDGITSTVNQQGVSISQINQKADSITSTVTNLQNTANQTYSQITQTADKIKAVVVQGSDSSSWELSPDQVAIAIKNQTEMDIIFDSNGETIKNGALTIEDSSGNFVMGFKDGVAVVQDIDVKDTTEGSWFHSAIYNLVNPHMTSLTCGSIEATDIKVSTGNIDLDGQGIYSFVEEVCRNVLRDEGLI